MLALDPMEVGVRLAVAGLGGLGVGIEREWSSKVAGKQRFAGVRTFFLLGLIGGISAEIIARGFAAPGAAIFIAASAVAVAAYVVSGIRSDVEGTTEVSALVVLAAGFLAGSGQIALAASIFAITALALVEKSRIHSLVYALPPETLEAAARFAVLALVVLPILPPGPYGPPPGVRPRELWALVLLFSGLSFAGFVAMHAAGARRGYTIAGLLGGLVSSTAVTLNFARESRASGASASALALGAVGASTMLFVRTGAVLLLLRPALALETARYLVFPFVTGLVWLLVARRTATSAGDDATIAKNPLRLVAAIQMAVAFQVVLFLVHLASDRFGSSGTFVSAALLGLTDVDALTYSMLRFGGEGGPTAVAATALALGILSNTLLKLVLAVAIGRGRFRALAGTGLAILAAATAVTLFLFH